MRFIHESDVESFRDEVRQFIADELPPEEERLARSMSGGFQTNEEEYDYTMGFQRKLAGRGWLAMAWPEEYGGGGASHMRQLVYNEEDVVRRGARDEHGHLLGRPLAHALRRRGAEAHLHPAHHQRRPVVVHPLQRARRGSDLASLQTSATRDGDDYVINGQKIWTSGGHLADWGWLAARTDPDAPKHKGISLLMLDMKSPGITVRPLVNMSDQHAFNEVFFEDVRVPVEQRVGEENRGWYHLAVALDFGAQRHRGVCRGAAHDRALRQARAGAPALWQHRQRIRTELAERAIEVNVGTFLAYRVATMQARGLLPNHEASASKLFGSELGQRIALTGMHMLGMSGQLRGASSRIEIDQAQAYLYTVSGTIAAGTSEIQRNIMPPAASASEGVEGALCYSPAQELRHGNGCHARGGRTRALVVPRYGFAEADRLARVSAGTSKRWTHGYSYRSERG